MDPTSHHWYHNPPPVSDFDQPSYLVYVSFALREHRYVNNH